MTRASASDQDRYCVADVVVPADKLTARGRERVEDVVMPCPEKAEPGRIWCRWHRLQ